MKTKQILPIDLYLEYKKGRKERETEIIEVIDNIDLKVFFTQLQDTKTGKILDMPKELFNMFMQFWRYIEEDLIKQIKEKK